MVSPDESVHAAMTSWICSDRSSASVASGFSMVALSSSPPLFSSAILIFIFLSCGTLGGRSPPPVRLVGLGHFDPVSIPVLKLEGDPPRAVHINGPTERGILLQRVQAIAGKANLRD